MSGSSGVVAQGLDPAGHGRDAHGQADAEGRAAKSGNSSSDPRKFEHLTDRDSNRASDGYSDCDDEPLARGFDPARHGCDAHGQASAENRTANGDNPTYLSRKFECFTDQDADRDS